MLARFWGRYVGVRFAGEKVTALLRDPSGALKCVAWANSGLDFAASSPEPWVLERLRPAWQIDVHRLAKALHDPVAPTGALMLKGPVGLEPGTVQPVPLEEPAQALWRPADFARRSLEAWPSVEEAASRLAAAIDEAVQGLASVSGPLAAEISGGLDSSLVASSLVRYDPGAVRLWINAYASVSESDERDYAAALGRFLGFDVVSVPHATEPMTAEWLNAISQGFRPGLNGLDRPFDLDWSLRARESGATALMTGKGGDSILLQALTADVFTDHVQSRGWRALFSAETLELAAATEASIWSLAIRAWRHDSIGSQPLVRQHPMLARIDGLTELHPWLADCDAFGPAKRFQMAGVADSVSHHGASSLTASIDVRNPLCAQPVIEAGLSLPTPLLTLNGRDRGLARHAFRDRLPAVILDRRSKGEMTRFYGRLVLKNLDLLRPWLLDGRLADLGLLDRIAAEVELRPETLLWRGQYAFVLVIAAYEGWVRAWEARLAPRS